MNNLVVAGGDNRMLYLAQQLEKDGWNVETIGLREKENVHMENADAVLFPYPFLHREDGSVPTLNGQEIRIQEILKNVCKGTVLLAGRGMEDDVWQESFCVKRYTDAEGFEERNARISAEAAVCECMLCSPKALMDSSILITGYGLFGRALALKMKALSATVYIAARREEQRMQAQNEGMQSVSIVEMADVLGKADLILNTIPARVFGEYHLKQLKRECWMMELASAPYGFDMETACRLGINCAAFPGLPGRYSPLSAAMALRDAVNKLLGRKGE